MKNEEPIFEGYRDIGRLHMDDLSDLGKAQDFKVPLDGIGGTVIFTKALIYSGQNGVRFPTELVNRHYIETEGFAQWALNEGYTVVGLPNLIATHA